MVFGSPSSHPASEVQLAAGTTASARKLRDPFAVATANNAAKATSFGRTRTTIAFFAQGNFQKFNVRSTYYFRCSAGHFLPT
jgi:hypothetical protein